MRKTALILSVSLLLSSSAFAQRKQKQVDTTNTLTNIEQTLDLIKESYVDNPDMRKLSETAIAAMLNKLDPHSAYIPARNVERANESLNGNFEGVGIAFSIVNDTINVSDVIIGGPSEKVGLVIGDKIISIDGESSVGDSINNAFVTKHLRGKKGTVVNLSVIRQGYKEPINFTIVRDKVPIYSVDCSFMVNDSIGYIRLARFARSSAQEVRKAIDELRKQGMKSLIFDLRGNSGGFLDVACQIVDEFLPAKRLIVYTEGRNSPRQNFKTTPRGSFITGDLVLLVDEYSASASEIVSGAIQDWDRGTLIGRRTFGKGLVQRQYTLKDGSQLRLTNARYYTPSGRCIQKPYDNGSEAYLRDLEQRYKHGELSNVDSIHFPDSLKFRTSKGRTVYGGGGIMPDIFIPIDTTRLSDYYLAVRAKGLLTRFPQEWADRHRQDSTMSNFDSFLKHYDASSVDSLFVAFAAEQGILKGAAPDSAAVEEKEGPVYKTSDAFSDDYLSLVVKAMVARDLFGSAYYTQVVRVDDHAFEAAIQELMKKK